MKLLSKSSRLMGMILAIFILSVTNILPVNAQNLSFQSEKNSGIDNYSVSEYQIDSRERYIASIAEKYDISYYEAEAIEKKESMISPQSSDEILKYKTIDKVAGTISNGKGYSVKPHIATEVKYVYNKATRKVVSLENIGGPYLYIPGISNCTLSSGTFNITKNRTSGRVSVTGSVVYTTASTTVTVGNDIVGVSKTTGGYKVTSKAKTFAIEIKESNLN